MKEVNGYNLNQNEYEILLKKMYGFEEYYYYKNETHHKDYISILNDLDKLNKLPIEYRNALLGWYIFFKTEYRWINHKHPCFRITDSCQLKCKHCYNRKIKRTNRMMTYDEFLFLHHRLQTIGNSFVHSTFYQDKNEYHFEGGEATLNPHLLKMIKFCNKQNIKTILLTNGYDIPDEIINYFKDTTSMNKIQVSIDGFEENHNFMRGDGNYSKVINTIQKLQENSIPFNCNMVVHNDNVNDFFPLQKFIKTKYSASTGPMIYNDQVIPELQSLNKNDLKKITRWRTSRGYISCRDGYECKAGHQIIVKESGDINFCGVGLSKNITNLYTDSIEESLEKIKINTIRYRSIPVYCFDCERLAICKGGGLCSTHKLNGILNKEDINCHQLNWKIQKEGMLEQIINGNEILR